MNAADSQRLLQHIRRLAGDPQSTPSDGELLRRYLNGREEAAFTALVRRHGPMVFAVCQSVLRQRDDAEDAFQAAFLILARKAASIRRQEGLGGWLQRVAYRVALKARTDNLRRQQREAKTARSPVGEPSGDDLSWGELRAFLHAELAALPESLRAPLVLCYLEGRTQEEAAQQLGWSLSTLRGRLQRGRDKLRRRLARCGVAVTAALAAALTGQALAETAVRSCELLAMATATTAAAALARGFPRPLLSLKLVMLSALLLSMGVGIGGMALHSPPSEPRPSGSGESNRSLTVAAPKEAGPRAAIDVHGDPLPDGAAARLGTIRFNHGEGLNALFFTPDGKTILSEGNGGIRWWDAANGKELDRIRTAKPHIESQDQMILLADGKTFITLATDEEEIDGTAVHVWDLARKKETRKLTLPDYGQGHELFPSHALSPDGKLAIPHFRPPAPVHVFNLTSGKELYQLAKGDKTFLAAAFVGNDRIVSADQKQRIAVWEAQTGKLLRQFSHEAPIRYLAAAPDGRWLASLEQRPSPRVRYVEQEIVYLWDMDAGKVKQSFRAKPKHWFKNVCFSPNGKSLLTASASPSGGDEVVLWDCASGRQRLVIDAASGINADVLAISPDGSRLAAGRRVPASSGIRMGKFELWDLQTGRRLTAEDSRHTLISANRQQTQNAAVFLAPAGERAVLVGQDSLSSWDAVRGHPLHSFALPRDSRLYGRSLSSDGRYAVTFRFQGKDIHVLIWDIAAGKCLHTLRFPGEYCLPGLERRITTVFAADSSLLATWLGKQNLVHLWDVSSGKLVRSFPEGKDGWPGHMAFSADGKTLVVAGNHVTAYEVASGKELFSWRLRLIASRPEKSDNWGTLAISPDGLLIAATPWTGNATPGSKDHAIALYNARTGKLLRRCHDGATQNIFRLLAFSHDGQLLASTNGRGEIVQLWETATGKCIHTFKGHQARINSLAFSGDDRRLASASSDSTVLIWDVTGQAAKTTALTEEKLKQCWNDLAGEDASRAHRVVWTLIRAPRQSVPFLKSHLHPAKSVRREQMDGWVQDLDADAFDVRQKAAAELEKLGELAEPALRRALENKPTLEQRRRIEPMLAKLEAAVPSGDALRSLRAVRVLEHTDTAEARRLLAELAKGADGAILTRTAQAALTRLNRRLP